MCGRFTLQITKEMLEDIFGPIIAQDIQPRYNIAPSQQIPVVRTYPDNTRHLDLLKWGLIPSWAKDASISSRMINARSETVDEKPSFKSAIKHRRCIVPASGFYEWQAVEGKKKPYYITMKDNGPMLFAGLWDRWKSPEGDDIETCTILTTDTNDLIKPLHDRMPVILPPEAIDHWLDINSANPEELKHLLQPYSPELMQIYPVSEIVNSPKNDDVRCIKPLNSNSGYIEKI